MSRIPFHCHAIESTYSEGLITVSHFTAWLNSKKVEEVTSNLKFPISAAITV